MLHHRGVRRQCPCDARIRLRAFVTRRVWGVDPQVNAEFGTGGIKHTLLLGFEIGRQRTDNIRNEGFFPTPANPGGVQAIFAPVAQPNIRRGDIVWRQIATSGNNRGVAKVLGLYTQDQIEFAPWLQAIIGIRYDRFSAGAEGYRAAARAFLGQAEPPTVAVGAAAIPGSVGDDGLWIEEE